MTAHEHLLQCRKILDEQFGEGYAEQNPQLLAAMIQASAQDFHSAMLIKHLELELGRIHEAIDQLSLRLE